MSSETRRVRVAGLPDPGVEIAIDLHDAWAAEAAVHALDASPEELDGALLVRPSSERGLVEVSGALRASASAFCDRCGEPCARVAEADVRLLFAPSAHVDEAFDGGEIELSAEDLEIGWYDGGVIDLAEVLTEALVLALPSRVMCADRVECDKRTAQLLETSGRVGEGGLSGLQALRAKFE